ncbi:hypothetical protein ABZ694_24625 [Streptomyces albidoflavus]|uniref:hypothetical protein n=1 Tax=Streptomyces albidoflavus TaxID=1886 RepID=UPI0033D9044C
MTSPLNPDKQPALDTPDGDELPWTPPDPGPVTDPDPEPTPDPTPDPSEVPDPDTIAWEPQTWYSATVVCRTSGCPNENRVVDVPLVYSNNGVASYVQVVDGTCGKRSQFLTATKLDPQPEEE